MSPEDVATLNSGFLMILPTNTLGQRVLSYQPSKSTNATFEQHRRCFFYYFDLLIRMHSSDGDSEISLIILAFIDQKTAQDTVNETLVDIVQLFSKIEVVRIHVFFEAIGLGWYSYQANGKAKAMALFDPNGNNIEYHTLPSDITTYTQTNNNEKNEADDPQEQDMGEAFSIVFGFNKQHLPEWMGGGWDLSCFETFQNHIVSSQQQNPEGYTIASLF
jgi:hypothetical protein